MSKALIAGINQVATDKGLDREIIFDAIEAALISAYKRNYGSIANVTSEVDRLTGEMRVFAEREVVEDVINERTEITQAEARAVDPDAQLGDVVRVQTQPAEFGRIAAQTAKQVILQRIREAERDTVYENFAHRVGEILNAQVRSTDNVSGAVTVMLDDKHEALLMREEQIPGERLRRGDYVRVYIVDVHKSTRGPVIKLSRTHRNLLRRLMEQEIPEVRDGTVEIKAIAREPGARSKSAVVATVPGVDPVGSCVGMRGLRIQNIVNELAGEKIDVVEWNTDLPNYISNALSPAKVNSVILDESGSIKTAIVVVPDRQLSLAIGKEGQNARLAAKLTGWRIDIKSESEAAKEGLDRLAAQQAQTRTDDLFAVVERFLQDEEEKPVSEDLLSKAARALETMDDQPATAEAQGIDLPSIEELPELPTETTDSFEEMWPSADAIEDQITPIGEAFDPTLQEQSDTPEAGKESDDEQVSEEVPQAQAGADDNIVEEISQLDQEEELELEEELPEAESLTRVGDLPDVITADMLQKRKSVDFSADDFEIPAELLAGLEDDEFDDWDDDDDDDDASDKRVKAKSGTKSKAKKGKDKRPRRSADDEYNNF